MRGSSPGHRFDVLTYDYRGIGASRPVRLAGCRYRWRDWGELDFEAVLGFLRQHPSAAPLLVVGHSVGGFLPGLAESGRLVDRHADGRRAVCLVGRLRRGPAAAVGSEVARRHARADLAVRLLPRPPSRLAGRPALRRRQ